MSSYRSLILALWPWEKEKIREEKRKKERQESGRGGEIKGINEWDKKSNIYVGEKYKKGKSKCHDNSLFMMSVRDVYFKMWINLSSQVSLPIHIHGQACPCPLLGGCSPGNLQRRVRRLCLWLTVADWFVYSNTVSEWKTPSSCTSHSGCSISATCLPRVSSPLTLYAMDTNSFLLLHF